MPNARRSQLSFVGAAMLAAACVHSPAVTAVPAAAPVTVAAPATTVILVRHAEKIDASTDPVLSDAGATRAKLLADTLAGSVITGIVVTQFQRTRLTAQPLAMRLGLEPIIVSAAGPGIDHARAVATLVRGRFAGKTVFVVGHSNSVPAIIRALGVTSPVAIPDWKYDDMFVVSLDASGRATLSQSRYGATSIAPAAP